MILSQADEDEDKEPQIIEIPKSLWLFGLAGELIFVFQMYFNLLMLAVCLCTNVISISCFLQFVKI